MIDFGYNVQQAISAPRWRSARFRSGTAGGELELLGQADIDEYLSTAVSETVVLEDRFPSGVALALDLLGHRTSIDGPWEDGMGHAQAIVIHPDTRLLEGAADPRCDGLALGW
jgi:gamma-glutamyltranspeptidase